MTSSIDLLDEGVVVYLDDILIYSEDEKSHIDLVRRVMERIRVAKLCFFFFFFFILFIMHGSLRLKA